MTGPQKKINKVSYYFKYGHNVVISIPLHILSICLSVSGICFLIVLIASRQYQ